MCYDKIGRSDTSRFNLIEFGIEQTQKKGGARGLMGNLFSQKKDLQKNFR